jgi:hypothetical protein
MKFFESNKTVEILVSHGSEDVDVGLVDCNAV